MIILNKKIIMYYEITIYLYYLVKIQRKLIAIIISSNTIIIKYIHYQNLINLTIK